MPKRILIVDDDERMRRELALQLAEANYTPVTAASGEEALALAQLQPPDLVLLDIGLPGMDGLEVLRTLQQQFHHLPVIFVTVHRRELDEIVGLELGADDYITKPFQMDVLLAHVKAVLRRADASASRLHTSALAPQPPLIVGDLVIDPAAHTAQIGERVLNLSQKEFALLTVLARHAGQVLSLEDLLTQVWGADWIGESETLYVHIRWLRQKIEPDPAHPQRLLTVRGVGYKLVQ